MATAPTSAPPLYRHPLGLPAGSVRAALVVMIVGLFWLQLLRPAPPPDKPPVTVPAYLYMLLALVLAFFAAHGKSIAAIGSSERSPLYLPRGFFRWAVVLGTAAVVAFELYSDPEQLKRRLTPTEDDLRDWPYLVLSLGGGFLLGWIAHLGPWRNAPAFQDVQAWVSLIGMLSLAVELLLSFFIESSLGEAIPRLPWHCAVTAIVAFYFGVRS